MLFFDGGVYLDDDDDDDDDSNKQNRKSRSDNSTYEDFLIILWLNLYLAISPVIFLFLQVVHFCVCITHSLNTMIYESLE